jgi:rhamnosyltransferase
MCCITVFVLIQDIHEDVAYFNIDTERLGVIIPTLNAARHWPALEFSLSLQGLHSSQVLIVDSSSTDDTLSLAQRAGFRVLRIPRDQFNHGATRQHACDYLPWAEYLVFMTQDAVLAHERSIECLCRALEDEGVGAAYGRQLPRETADPIERHGRFFNYPPTSQVRSLESRAELGFKAVFFSDSFAVYRRSALESVGGFPSDAIVSEEVTVAARMLLAGWKVAYQADAIVVHSHSLTLSQEFSRYFDIGVHHGRTPWLTNSFGTTRNQGRQYVLSELRSLWTNAPSWIPYALMRTFSKYVAYRLGTIESRLPQRLNRMLSNHPGYWPIQKPEIAPIGRPPVPYSLKPHSDTK